jgi:imidazolonepropionase-like amidohydrolase
MAYWCRKMTHKINFNDMKILFNILSVLGFISLHAQETVYPAKPQEKPIAITNGTIHIGNGDVIDRGTIVFTGGRISYVGAAANIPDGATKIDATGKQVYPGLILSGSQLGLQEAGSGTRATNDYAELGDINPNIRSIVAYNSDSKIINTLRSNGILLAATVPVGGLISGTSSVVQLDAWNWEDAAYGIDNGIHFNMPGLLNRPNPLPSISTQTPAIDAIKSSLDRIEQVRNFFREAKAYLAETKHDAVNLKYEAVKGLFDRKQKLFVHCNLVKEMLVAVEFAKLFSFDVVIVGGSESYQVADILKKSNIPVILDQMHRLPTSEDDDFDQPYKTPAILKKAGVLFAINDVDGQTRGRNLMYNAGTAVAYGLTQEDALRAITLDAATILGIASRTGSLEAGKDANIVISEGDILDMRSSRITHAFIQGRTITLDDKQKQLNQRYRLKYGLTK